MINDKQLHISIGQSRKTNRWPRSPITWSEFCRRLSTPVVGAETYDQYMAMPKSKQDDLKDVGGFVGGTFAGDIRKAPNVEGRDLITLDLDNVPAGKTGEIIRTVKSLGCASAIYSTRKHTEAAPRLRIIIPLAKTVSPDAYEPIARRIALMVGIAYCDPTTFEASRLMYWPSKSADATYVYEVNDAPFCDGEAVLNMYSDWRNVAEWPQVPGVEAVEKRRVARQEDPLTKLGIVGAFCRCYTITEAMDHFIPGMYEATIMPDRFTFTGGSTVGGAVLYDGDKFLYSHHATDPCSGQLVNAWDLIRLHMYGDQDAEAKEGTPNSKLPSYTAMQQLAMSDSKVSELMQKERLEEARQKFGDQSATSADVSDLEWTKLLQSDQNGKFINTINNAIVILENDPLLKGKIAFDAFASSSVALGPLPWNESTGKRRWTDADDSGYYWYLEHFYRITGREKLDSAFTIVRSKHTINDVKDYLVNLEWDGKHRIDTLLSDYLGAEDNIYTRAVIRKALVAAVGRAVIGAIKYDYMPILTGPQGIGKSTFLANLGKEWFSDSLTTFEGKEAAELIQGTWINEIGELTALSKQETNSVKQFLSKTHDIYRAAYGRRTEKYPRRCVFFGTSNESEFLKDTTGNRRFWPVDVGKYPSKKSVWDDLPDEVDQIWAEALMYFQAGEPLYLASEVASIARQAQEQHANVSEKEGIIREFLEREIPENWNTMSVQLRRMFLSGNASPGTKLVSRSKVCIAEIWVECLNGDLKSLKRTDSAEIAGILARIEGWEKMPYPTRFGEYGNQKGYYRGDYQG